MADRFEDLPVYRQAYRFTTELYRFIALSSMQRDFAFADQLRRALISITNNIAEGYERDLINEKRYFLRVAKGSTGEVRSMLHLALALGYLSKDDHDRYCASAKQISCQLAGYIRYLAK